MIKACGAALAQELLPPTRATLSLTGAGTSSTQGPVTQLFVDQTRIVTLGGQGIAPPAGACVCTNLNYVTVICEDCDRAASVDLCHTHDRACEDAAQMGGIREHNTFFCTTVSD